MIIEDDKEWRKQTESCSPYWQPDWVRRYGRAVLVVAEDSACPFVVRKSGNRVHMACPPGEVGMYRPKDGYPFKPRPKPKPERLIEAANDLGVTSAFIKDDPFGHGFETELETMELPCSIEIATEWFRRERMCEAASDRKRALRKLSDLTTEVFVGSWGRHTRAFCAAHQETMAKAGKTGLTEHEVDWIVGSADWSTVIVEVTENGKFVAGEIVLTRHEKAVVPFGATDPAYRKIAPGVLSLTVAIEACRDLGIQAMNIGGGVSPGDALEWWKVRFGGTRLTQTAALWSGINDSTDDGTFPAWLKEAE